MIDPNEREQFLYRDVLEDMGYCAKNLPDESNPRPCVLGKGHQGGCFYDPVVLFRIGWMWAKRSVQ